MVQILSVAILVPNETTARKRMLKTIVFCRDLFSIFFGLTYDFKGFLHQEDEKSAWSTCFRSPLVLHFRMGLRNVSSAAKCFFNLKLEQTIFCIREIFTSHRGVDKESSGRKTFAHSVYNAEMGVKSVLAIATNASACVI